MYFSEDFFDHGLPVFANKPTRLINGPVFYLVLPGVYLYFFSLPIALIPDDVQVSPLLALAVDGSTTYIVGWAPSVVVTGMYALPSSKNGFYPKAEILSLAGRPLSPQVNFFAPAFKAARLLRPALLAPAVPGSASI